MGERGGGERMGEEREGWGGVEREECGWVGGGNKERSKSGWVVKWLKTGWSGVSGGSGWKRGMGSSRLSWGG